MEEFTQCPVKGGLGHFSHDTSNELASAMGQPKCHQHEPNARLNSGGSANVLIPALADVDLHKSHKLFKGSNRHAHASFNRPSPTPPKKVTLPFLTSVVPVARPRAAGFL